MVTFSAKEKGEGMNASPAYPDTSIENRREFNTKSV